MEAEAKKVDCEKNDNFHDIIGAFSEKASDVLNELKNLQNQTIDEYEATLKYFKGDPEWQSKDFFAIFDTFAQKITASFPRMKPIARRGTVSVTHKQRSRSQMIPQSSSSKKKNVSPRISIFPAGGPNRGGGGRPGGGPNSGFNQDLKAQLELRKRRKSGIVPGSSKKILPMTIGGPGDKPKPRGRQRRSADRKPPRAGMLGGPGEPDLPSLEQMIPHLEKVKKPPPPPTLPQLNEIPGFGPSADLQAALERRRRLSTTNMSQIVDGSSQKRTTSVPALKSRDI